RYGGDAQRGQQHASISTRWSSASIIRPAARSVSRPNVTPSALSQRGRGIPPPGQWSQSLIFLTALRYSWSMATASAFGRRLFLATIFAASLIDFLFPITSLLMSLKNSEWSDFRGRPLFFSAT